MNDTSLGKYVRERLECLGMTQKELAAELRVGELRLSRVLAGKRKIAPREILRLAGWCEVGAETILMLAAADDEVKSNG